MRGREEILDALAEADTTERAADIAADIAANFVMHILAAAIGVSDWQVCDGTETWEGDVASTVYSVLRAGGVLDKETDETAMARAARVEAERDAARAEVERLRKALNTPELHDFAAGVVSEAQHQRERWGASHDAGKAPEDWFWLLGYLGGKALHAAKAGDTKKALHHTISTAAALANWHAALLGAHSAMRPGIGEGSAVYPAALAALAAKEGGQ